MVVFTASLTTDAEIFEGCLHCDHHRHRYGKRRIIVIFVIVFVVNIVGREEMDLDAFVPSFSTRRWEMCRKGVKVAVKSSSSLPKWVRVVVRFTTATFV